MLQELVCRLQCQHPLFMHSGVEGPTRRTQQGCWGNGNLWQSQVCSCALPDGQLHRMLTWL